VAWTDAIMGGAFALAGVALQQMLTWHGDQRQSVRARQDRSDHERHIAFVELIKAGRRVQRALVDRDAEPTSAVVRERLAAAVDGLAETVAVVRLVSLAINSCNKSAE
jgi:hypothetical protein